MNMKNTVLIVVFFVFSTFTFGQDLRAFMSNGLYGYKRDNTIVIPAKFAYAAEFSFGRAAVLMDKKWGYIDTDGKLVIPNNLDIAESFHAPYVFFHEKKFIGLMDTMGERVVPAVCDEIFDNGNAWYLKKGKFHGAYLAEYGRYIEPKYMNIDFNEHFIIARIDRTFDVYSRSGKLLAANVTQSPVIPGRSYNSKYCDLSWPDSTFVIDEIGNKITGNYEAIHRESAVIPVELEGVYNNRYNDIFLLHLPASDEEIMADENGEIYSNRFHLLFGETYLNDAVYSDYGTQGREFMVKKNGVWSKFENGKLVPAKYLGAEQFNAYWLLSRVDSTIDVVRIGDKDTLFVAHFYRALIPENERINEYFNPEYDGSTETFFERTYFPIVEVQNESGKFAIYDLDQELFITPFSANHFLLQGLNHAFSELTEKRDIYIFNNEDGLIEYSLNNLHSGFVFNDYEAFFNFGILFKNESGRRVFVPYSVDTVIELPAYTSVSLSSMYSSGMESYVDLETGNEFWNESANNFTFDFLVLTDASDWPKYGFMNSDYSIVQLPEFDKIYGSADQGMHTQHYELIVTELNGLYGAYDLQRKIEIEPQYKAKLEFEFSSDTYFPYAQPDSLNYYLGSTGRKFHAKYNDGYPFKLKGKIGYISYNDFDPDVETDTIIPAVYAAFEPLYDIPYHIVGNKSKKEGLLSLIGDTLLPLEYNDISWDENYYSGYDQSSFWFVTTENKKKGLYNAMSFTSIPAIYDDIEMLEFHTQNNATVYKVTTNGKCGVYDERLNLLAPCEYDGIDLFMDGDYLTATIQKGDKVGVFRNYSGSFNMSDSSCWYDYIVGPVGYRKTESGYDMFMPISNTKIGSADQIEFLQSNLADYEIFEKEGLLGLKGSQTKKVLAKPTMRYIRLIDDSGFIKFENGITYYGSLYDKKAKYRMSEW